MLEATRELTLGEADQVHGGGDYCCTCYCPPCPPTEPPAAVLGNPGNLHAVGRAGEDPSNNPPRDFVLGGTHVGGNGAHGASAN